MKVVLELNPEEALVILDPIQGAALDDQRNAARWSGEASEYASVRAQMRGRIATAIVDQLFPEHQDAPTQELGL